MATFRVGVGSFNIKDSAVGIGTETTGHGNLRVEGVLKSTNLDVLGVSTFTRYSGFSADNININNRDLSLSGEYSTTGDIVVNDGDSLTVGLGPTACVGTVECISVENHFSVPVGDTAQRNEVSGYAEGTIRYNTDFETLEFFNGDEWKQFRYQSDVKTNPQARGRGVIASGYIAPLRQDTIDFIEISSQGNAQDFGNLDNAKAQPGPGASNPRGLFAGGMTPGATNQIEYITIPSTGNGIDFGDLTRSCNNPGGASNSTRMLAAGSNTPSGASNVIDLIEMQTLGNAVDFGDLSRSKYPAGVQSPTRAVWAGGYTPNGENNSIEYSLFASKNHTTTFGNLTQTRGNPASGGNSIRGIFAGGWGGPASMITSIEYLTIASTGNADRFGDLTEKMSEQMGSCANSVRCTFAGGNNPNQNPLNTISFVTIATTGNATDFGDLTLARRGPTSLSDSHGGLGGY